MTSLFSLYKHGIPLWEAQKLSSCCSVLCNRRARALHVQQDKIMPQGVFSSSLSPTGLL